MGEHVVHLARDPGALVRAGLLDSQLLLGLAPRSARSRSVHSSSRREPMYMPQPSIAMVNAALTDSDHAVRSPARGAGCWL